tara:strand:+ start:6397 stop:7320 length:924 start_codon:yes stop_codon:yes gene_type:complete
MSYKCKVCHEEFDTEKGLHIHLKKHKMDLATYYTTFFPRYNMLTGDPLPFKNKEDYFNHDFSTRRQLLKWCMTESEDKVKKYTLLKLKKRIEDKDLKFAPNHLELKISQLPDIDVYKKLFGSYSEACKEIGVKPLLGKSIDSRFFNDDEEFENLKILIDTREQKPLTFMKSEELKLDFGDYTVGGDDYNYTYVDRKAEQDFKGTLSGGMKRFRRELERVREFGSYLFIVVESDLTKIYKNNMFGPHKSNLNFIYHNMRLLTHEFKGHCQFVFTGNRANSQSVIPKILSIGEPLWGVDLQYWIDKEGI